MQSFKTSNRNISGWRKHDTSKILDVDGKLERRKAHLVAKGYNNQRFDADFNGTFVPLARLNSIRTAMAASVENDMSIFNHASIKRDDCVSKRKIRRGNIHGDTWFFEWSSTGYYWLQLRLKLRNSGRIKNSLKNPKWRQIFFVKKALHGLKQTSRQCDKILDVELRNLRLMPLESDSCDYTAKSAEDLVIVVYGDDMIIESKN